MKYVITGDTGFIGKNLLNRLDTGENEFLLIRREYSLIDAIPEFNPDYIFHCAAEIYDTGSMVESNIILTHKLLEVSKDINYKCFVNVGSSSEYGYKTHPMKESDVLVPRNMYEATKSSATMLCTAYSITYDKPIVTVRPFSVYGRFEKPHRFIPTLFEKFGSNTAVTIYPGVHDYIYIDDFIDAVLQICTTSDSKGDIVNIGSGIQYSNMDVFNLLVDIFGYEPTYSIVNSIMHKYDSETWVADVTKLVQKYKFNHKFTLKTGLEHMYSERYK